MAAQSNISKLIVKAMGLFGGVKVLDILCSIVRTKLVAMWIGTVGVGLFGIFNQALELLTNTSNLGVRQSSVRDLSQAASSHEEGRLPRMMLVVRRWSLWLGLAGTALTIALSPALSQLTFGDTAHSWHYIALSVALLLMAVANSETAILQGTARLKPLASVGLAGAVGGLLISIPLFYFLRERSIIPSIIAYAACNAVAAWVLRNRDYKMPRISVREIVQQGGAMVKFGIFMTLGSIIILLASYAFVAWLNYTAGTEQVGLYQAGYTLIIKYTGILLVALGMEYYPRLAGVAHSRMRLSAYVSQEISLAMMFIAPVAALFLLLRVFVVHLLYTPDFDAIINFVAWGMLGTVLRTLSWCISFVMLAKGDGKIYLLTESASAVLSLALNVVCYTLWGITGLGVAFVVWYAAYTLMVTVVYTRRYHLRLNSASLASTAWSVVIVGATVATAIFQLTALTAVLTAMAVLVALWQAKRTFMR